MLIPPQADCGWDTAKLSRTSFGTIDGSQQGYESEFTRNEIRLHNDMELMHLAQRVKFE